VAIPIEQRRHCWYIFGMPLLGGVSFKGCPFCHLFFILEMNVLLPAGFSDIKEPGKIIGPRCCAFVKSCALRFD
jgi:hypothetical protein